MEILLHAVNALDFESVQDKPAIARAFRADLIENIVRFSNEVLEIDPAAVSALFMTRHPCNEALADHPTVQVHTDKDGGVSVGLLGLLNGLCGIGPDGYGYISAQYDTESGKVLSFKATLPEAV